ncbi:uncharacterized protein C8Q71DRAFT_859792 [Rhodofomes roseus]|uniref:Plasmid replication DNA-binding protein KfrA n=1 Tax=Rhodofomes roseus TaxID=34475 RepID=A0ABQ8KA34_9APHY|nr:uncharacterized protein C8Q71DRAFT_859792 [Rhodofomes roseus]KAH9834128.1 hypothetical protein C8Q71DRAFT_859792 [Rhodofomes roseus]
MTEDTNGAHTIVKFISSLGGPVYAAEEVAWASSVPQGKALLEWLASQVRHHAIATHIEGGGDDVVEYRASLDPIALHERELRELFSATTSEQSTRVRSNNAAGYISPSILSTRSSLMEKESELLEDETRLLKHRLKSSKVAAKDLTQAIKALQIEVETVGKEIQQQDARLNELCINADTVVSRSARTAERLLELTKEDGPADGSAEQSRTSPVRDSLVDISSLHGSVASAAASRLAAVDEAAASLPTPTEVKQEVARLQASLENSRGRQNHVNAYPDSRSMSTDAYCAELDRISHLLESVSDTENKQRLLNDLVVGERSELKVDDDCVDIVEEVARAWSLDQAAILEAREKIVDEAIKRFTEDLLPPLGVLHRALAARSEYNLEAEALVSVLIEELEEVADDVAAVKQHMARASASAEAADAREKHAHALLEEELTELLKRTQGSRPPDARPLVLLEREDVTMELKAVRERAQAADEGQTRWTSTLAPKLAELSSTHADLLAVVYENAPVNTSPPFGLPTDARAVVASIKETAIRLDAMLQRLQKDSQLGDRDKRKLTAFVEKWAR